MIILFTYLFTYSYNLDSLISVGVDNIYSIKFKKAYADFDKVEQLKPNGAEAQFFKTMILWWEIQLDYKDSSFDNKFLEAVDKTIKKCDIILEKNPHDADALFYKGGALGFKGRLFTFRSKWFSAAMAGKNALPILKTAKKYAKDNVDLDLGFGIYDYYAKAIPQKYSFVKPFMVFFPKGDKKRGIRELKNVEKNGKFAKNEAMYQLLMVYYMFENSVPKALEYAKKLHTKFPDNPIFQRYLGRSYIKAGELGNAHKIYKNILAKYHAKFYGYNLSAYEEANFYLGYIFYKIKKYSASKRYFKIVFDLDKKFNRENKSGYYVFAKLYMGNIYDVEKRRNEAVKYYKSVLDYKKYGDSKRLAKKYLTTPYR